MKFLKSMTSGLMFAAVLMGTTPLQAAEYKLDPTHSFVEFKIQHLGYSWLLGRFNKMDGTFNYDAAADNAAQNISVTVDTTSLDSNHAERDKHLSKMLNVSDFGTATFVSTGYTGDADAGIMAGKLTLHGVTKDVEIAVKKIGEGKDPWGGYRAGFEGELKINRKEYGVSAPLGPKSWDMVLSLFIEGIRK